MGFAVLLDKVTNMLKEGTLVSEDRRRHSSFTGPSGRADPQAGKGGGGGGGGGGGEGENFLLCFCSHLIFGGGEREAFLQPQDRSSHEARGSKTILGTYFPFCR